MTKQLCDINADNSNNETYIISDGLLAMLAMLANVPDVSTDYTVMRF